MSLCAICRTLNEELCDFHTHVPDGDDWAQSNRLMCDFLHRGIVPVRVPELEWWTDPYRTYMDRPAEAVCGF